MHWLLTDSTWHFGDWLWFNFEEYESYIAKNEGYWRLEQTFKKGVPVTWAVFMWFFKFTPMINIDWCSESPNIYNNKWMNSGTGDPMDDGF